MLRRARQTHAMLIGVIDRFKAQRHLLLDTLVLGVAGALGARVFMVLLGGIEWVFLEWFAGYHAPALPGEGGATDQQIGPWGLILIPIATTVGGLLSGWLVYTFSPEAEGHGTDGVVQAYHNQKGKIRARVPVVKTLASAITIGSGGSAGREGPIALIASGFGSVYANLTERNERERRLLVLAGMAAGLAAIFRSPVGTAIFAIEVLYGTTEFDGRALLHTLLASVVAYALNGLFVGYGPLFEVPTDLPMPHAFSLLAYAGLGVAIGPVAVLIPVVFYRIRDAFAALPGPRHIKPALGGLGLGLLALWLPQVLGGGYGWIQKAIDGELALTLLGMLALAKLIAFSLTVSSGGSAGVFAPTLFVGCMVGGLMASLFQQPTAGFAVVGMAATFGAAARVPIATILMVTEMTGGYKLLVAAAVAVMLAYLIQSTLAGRLKYKSLYEAQVFSVFDSPAHYDEHIDAVMKLLDDKQIELSSQTARSALTSLVRAGTPMDLPGSQRLVFGRITRASQYADKFAEEDFTMELSSPHTSSNRQAAASGEAAVERPLLLAVFRGSRMLTPRPRLKLRAEDRVLMLAHPGSIPDLQ